MMKTLCLSILGVFCYSFLAAPYAEASFWKERKASVENTVLARLPGADLPRVRGLQGGLETVHPVSRLPAQLSSHLPQAFSLPFAYTQFKRASIPTGWKPSDPLIIQIQDVHQNYEAQANIGHAIQELIDRGQADLVALEGAFEPVDVSRFRSFDAPDAIRKAADFLLKEGKITGPMHTAMTSPKDIPPFVGIDDEILHGAHVQAYTNSVPKAAEQKARLAEDESALEKQKSIAFNRELVSFDAAVQAYRKGESGPGIYIQVLAKIAGPLPAQAVKFLKALTMERSLDFKKVEEERSAMLRALVASLTRQDNERLVNLSLAYRLGKVSHTDFYGELKDLCAKAGVPCKNYPAMSAYLEYVLASDQIDVETFITELRALEERAYSRLVRSPKEKGLLDQSRRLYLKGKLLDFALTPEEWTEYSKTPSPELSSFESFFLRAALRDKALADNLLKSVSERKARIVVLVAGGHHSSGVEKIIRSLDPKAAVITLAPKITKIEKASGTEYLSVFSQEKSPLEKLFDGDKLFVSQKILTPGLERQIASDAGVAFPEILNGKDQDVPDTIEEKRFAFLAGHSAEGFSATAKDTDNGVRVENTGPQGIVPYTLSTDEKSDLPVRKIEKPLRNWSLPALDIGTLRQIATLLAAITLGAAAMILAIAGGAGALIALAQAFFPAASGVSMAVIWFPIKFPGDAKHSDDPFKGMKVGQIRAAGDHIYRLESTENGEILQMCVPVDFKDGDPIIYVVPGMMDVEPLHAMKVTVWGPAADSGQIVHAFRWKQSTKPVKESGPEVAVATDAGFF